MIKKISFSVVIFIVACFIISCGGNKKKETSEEIKDTLKNVNKVEIQTNKKYTDIARFISGMSVDEKSELYELSQTGSFKSYVSSSDSSWARFEKKRLAKMRTWAGEEISDINKDLKTLFYPFSGPDFVHAYTLFPKATTYIMFGLEPVGNIPDFNKIPKEKLGDFFSALNYSIEDALSLSFFKTIDMSKELNSELISGALPVILLFVARTGHEIVDIKPIDLDKNGKIKVIDSFLNLKSEASYNKGAEITFIQTGDSIIRKIIYFSANVADGGLKLNLNCENYFKNMEENVVTMVKSATYLMHKGHFSIIRNTVLSKSKSILQDDSGIAYKFFDSAKWNIQLYGEYKGPIALFANHFETDLQQAYAKLNIKPVSFQYGYGSHSVVLVARKK